MWPFVALGWFVVWSKWSKIGLQEFRIRMKFEFRMKLSGVYRMSDDGVYPSSVTSFLGYVELESGHSRSNFGDRWPVVALGWFVVWSKWSKNGLQEF